MYPSLGKLTTHITIVELLTSIEFPMSVAFLRVFLGDWDDHPWRNQLLYTMRKCNCKITDFNLTFFLICQHNKKFKVNSVEEPCAKCFALHISKFGILQTTEKNQKNPIKMLYLYVCFWKTERAKSLHNVLCLIFLIWFAKFQILICELQGI